MNKTYVAAIDLGATSGRVIVGAYSPEGLELTEVHRFPNAFHTLGGYDYWDMGGFFAQIQKGLQEARRLFPQLVSCGVDTWGVDHVLVDGQGRMVFPVHAYRDERTARIRDRIQAAGEARRLYEWTGLPVINYNTSFQLAEAVERFPALRQMVERVLFLPDYFNFLLSGRMVNEFSIASTSQLLALHGEDFSADALDYFGIPRGWFAKPTRAGARLGQVRGLAGLEGVEVVLVPGHDTSCAYETIPAQGKALLVSAGTWLLVGGITGNPAVGEDAFALGVSNERTGQGLYRPVKNLIGMWLFEQTAARFSSAPKKSSEWDALITAAEELPAAPVLLDTAEAALYNPKDMKAVIDGQLLARGGREPQGLAAYMRLICDSLGASVADAARRFAAMTGERFDNIIIVGGGSKNRLLCQRVADFSGMPVTSFSLEGTAVGNMGYQVVAAGAARDMAEFRSVIASGIGSHTYRPKG